MKEFLSYGTDIIQKEQALFASFFVLQNRLQIAGEKVQKRISMRQWHLLAMTQVCTPPRTLTSIGKLMGCSRQNVFCMAERQNEVLNKLFSNLTDKEVEKYFDLQNKLLDGLEKVEEYANSCKGD